MIYLADRFAAPPLIQNIESDDQGNVLHGTTEMLGCKFHARFIRVKPSPLDPDADDLVEPFDSASDDTKEMFADLQRINEGALHTVELPAMGIGCRWVMMIYPFAH